MTTTLVSCDDDYLDHWTLDLAGRLRVVPHEIGAIHAIDVAGCRRCGLSSCCGSSKRYVDIDSLRVFRQLQ